MARERESLQRIYDEVVSESGMVQEFSERIIRQFTADLDELVERVQTLVRKVRKGEVDEYTCEEMEADFVEISTMMYFASSKMATLGGQTDVAKAQRVELFNNTLLGVQGTQIEKKAKADRAIVNAQLMEDVFSRAYTELKTKLENADRVYNALKKVYSKKMLELEIFRKETAKRFYTGGGEDGE